MRWRRTPNGRLYSGCRRWRIRRLGRRRHLLEEFRPGRQGWLIHGEFSRLRDAAREAEGRAG